MGGNLFDLAQRDQWPLIHHHNLRGAPMTDLRMGASVRLMTAREMRPDNA